MLWLVEHLPEDSALAGSVRGGREHRVWTTQTHMHAAMVNQLYVANNQRAGKKTRKALIEPPKVRKTKKRVVTVAQLMARRRGARPPN